MESHEDYLWFTLERLAAIQRADNLGVDPYAKSLRGHGTIIHPLLFQRLQVNFPERFGCSQLIMGTTFDYHANLVGFSGSQLLNYLFQSFYEQEVVAGIEARCLYPKLSTKTQFVGEDDVETLRFRIEEWVDSEASGSRTVTMRTLLASQVGFTVAENLLNDFKSSDFCLDVLNFLESNNFEFPPDTSVQVNGRGIDTQLGMKAKYYPARDDHRAYCRDECMLRALAGSMLHCLILPKMPYKRLKLHTRNVVRAFERDMLDLKLFNHKTEALAQLLILLDISNFSGSFANTWVMLFSMALECAGPLKSKVQAFNVGQTVVLTTWLSVLVSYLYLTVGASCFVEELGHYATLPGGFLGVNANMTSSLLCMCFILQQLVNELRSHCNQIFTQAGGDDIAFVLSCPEGEVDYVVGYIRETCRKYIGELKLFEVIDLSAQSEGVIPNVLFCKKRILLSNEQSHWVLSSEPALPLHSSLNLKVPVGGYKSKVEAWYELDYGLKQYESQPGSFSQITDAFRLSFLKVYPEVSPLRRETVFLPSPIFRMKLLDNRLYSEEAVEVVEGIEDLEIGGYTFFRRFQTKFVHATHLKLVVCQQVIYRGSPTLMVMVPEQEFRLVRQTKTEYVIFDDEAGVYNVVLDKIENY